MGAKVHVDESRFHILHRIRGRRRLTRLAFAVFQFLALLLFRRLLQGLALAKMQFGKILHAQMNSAQFVLEKEGRRN